MTNVFRTGIVGEEGFCSLCSGSSLLCLGPQALIKLIKGHFVKTCATYLLCHQVQASCLA